jgi:hypothetical protein
MGYGEPTVTYGYDAAGNLTSQGSPTFTSSITNTYDDAGRLTKTTQPLDTEALRRTPRRAPDTAKLYNGKPALTRAGIGKRAAGLVKEGSYVNLGTGIPTQVSISSNRDVTLHAENGVLGWQMVSGVLSPRYYMPAQFVTAQRLLLDSVTSFEMAGGRINTVILCLRSRSVRQRRQLEHQMRHSAASAVRWSISVPAS